MILSFKPIKFPEEYNSFVAFRELADLEILGNFTHSAEKIRIYVERNISLLGPEAFLHVVANNQIIGQIELGKKKNFGYVHLFYLLPQYRGYGYFKIMHEKMLDIMRNNTVEEIRLSTTKTNINAINIYEHYGWVETTNMIENDDMISLTYILIYT